MSKTKQAVKKTAPRDTRKSKTVARKQHSPKPAKKSAPKALARPVKKAAVKAAPKKIPAKPLAGKKAPDKPVKKAAPPAAKTVPVKAAAKEPSVIPAKKAAAPTGKTSAKANKAPAQATKAPAKAAQSPAPPAPVVKVIEEAPAMSAPKAAKPVDKNPVATKSGALFYDSHMHTPLCKHAWGEPEEYAQQGIKAGMKGIIFTCHCPMPDGFWPSVRMADSEFDTYVAIVQRAADAFRGKIDVCLGLESEFFPGHEKWSEALHQRADFHYILGAVHWQAKDYLAKFETGTIENFRRTYFEHLAQSAECGLYDCLAHPDLVKNYHPDSWCFAIIKDSVAKALDRIAKTGVAMEMNTSGLNKSYSEMNPGNEMLRMMAERKIPVVIGSDAHRPVRVGEHFVTALNNLTEAGYDKISYFQHRQRIELKISEVLASIKKAADAAA